MGGMHASCGWTSLELPRADIGIGTGAAGLSVGAEAEHIDLAVQTWIQVLVSVAPRIRRQALEITVRLPVHRCRVARRPRDQRLQPLFRGGITLIVETIEL